MTNMNKEVDHEQFSGMRDPERATRYEQMALPGSESWAWNEEEEEEERLATMEQPLPANDYNFGEPIFLKVMSDLLARAEHGKAIYDTYLYADNGREPLVDAYQESLDLTLYLRQALEEGRDAEDMMRDHEGRAITQIVRVNGDSWPGVFIRVEDCMRMMHVMKEEVKRLSAAQAPSDDINWAQEMGKLFFRALH